jgi:type VII secretion protein EccB
MSSKKDLVEAHSFNRRRLVTAFVSGAPGGREVEPVRYGRTLVGGLVLAGLVVAGAAVSPLLTQKELPEGWNQKGMVVGKESGSRFVASDGRLFPVINTTSARLVLGGEGDFKVNFVPDDKIAQQKQGTTIGIPGAPDLLPAPSKLVQTGWTACTGESQGISVGVSTTPAAAPSTGQALVVTSADGGQEYVVSGGHKYAVPAGAAGRTVLRALGVDREKAQPVPGLWLDLVPDGTPLAVFSVPGAGSKVDTGVAGLDRVGTAVEVDGGPYVLGRKGLLPLSPFAYTIYRASGAAVGSIPQKRAGDVKSITTVHDPKALPYPADWPRNTVTRYTRSDSPCLLLSTHSGSAATVSLATPSGSSATTAGTTPTRTVQTGHGALVQATSGGVIGSGTVFLIDPTGTRYAVGSKGAEAPALAALGYDTVQPAAVPASWLELFADGPALTVAAAARSAAGQS